MLSVGSLYNIGIIMCTIGSISTYIIVYYIKTIKHSKTNLYINIVAMGVWQPRTKYK